jgi:hypothetical protein
MPVLRTDIDGTAGAAEAARMRCAVQTLTVVSGGTGAAEIRQAAVAVMMSLAFLGFAAERGLLAPARAAVGRLRVELERRAAGCGEARLSYGSAAWRRLRDVFATLYQARGGRLFDPGTAAWLSDVSDRTVLDMLRALPGSCVDGGPSDVERLGYLYEALLSVDGTGLRRSTGAHYTPRYLAERVVEEALEPLVYAPGPVQTKDRIRWRHRSSAEILSLRVADIAMGSAVFLAAAARYLAGHLAMAWAREGNDRTIVEARRQVIADCLYGVDVDPLAVELARLSLWLLADDPARPFTFLDDRVRHGDSLLGTTDRAARPETLAWINALAGDPPSAELERQPLHWARAFPEVLDRGGFDAIVGNPPFLGAQKLTGTLGAPYREYLVNVVGRGERGRADLVAYFALRANDLLGPNGQLGLIATNTLAQGDTREVGLDRIVADGATIRRAVSSRRWPNRSAALEYCAVWLSRAPLGERAERMLDGAAVPGITPSLDPQSRATGKPYRLRASGGIAFKGTEVTAVGGFTMCPEEAGALIATAPRNRAVLFPFLGGEDLNLRPDQSASRWIVNFHDWTEEEAASYPECYERLSRHVKPVLACNNDPALRRYWWRYKRTAPAMRAAVAGLGRIVAIALVSRTAMPAMVPTGQVLAHKLGVFATDDTAMLALLSSTPHYCWACAHSSTMKADLNYSPSDVFETLALPEPTSAMRELGDRLDRYRRDAVMLPRQIGLTATYNLVNDSGCGDADIVELRRIHRVIDEAVCRAYGWDDLVEQGLDHGFHSVGRGIRYTVGPALRREFVDRLLELNHWRYREEVAAGLRG